VKERLNQPEVRTHHHTDRLQAGPNYAEYRTVTGRASEARAGACRRVGALGLLARPVTAALLECSASVQAGDQPCRPGPAVRRAGTGCARNKKNGWGQRDALGHSGAQSRSRGAGGGPTEGRADRDGHRGSCGQCGRESWDGEACARECAGWRRTRAGAGGGSL